MTYDKNEYAKFSPRDKLATARLTARRLYPYFSAALLNLIPREAPGLGTLGVTENMVLLWDPEAVSGWSQAQLVGVLVHEVGHVLRAHAQRARAIGVVGQDGRPVDQALARVWNLAADCEINDDLLKAHPECFNADQKCPACAVKECSTHGVLPSTFGLQDGMTAEAYYQDLRQQKEDEARQLADALAQLLGPAGDGEGESQKGAPMRGRCGSCAGNPVDGEPSQAAGNDGRSEVEVQRVRKEVAEAIREEARRGRGSVPQGWARWAEATLSPPKVRWQDKLARLCRNAVAWKAGAVDLTHRRPSRRQWAIGTGTGRPLMPSLHAPVPQVDFWADTSGSMGSEELTIVLREARGIMVGTGARLRFGACDAAVHRLKAVANWHELPALLVGGGGTDFSPIFEAVLRDRRHRPDIIIVATDGDGHCPASPPPATQVIWLLTGKHRRRPCDWGAFIEVED
jgi:predicted metal-dependent peptidase